MKLLKFVVIVLALPILFFIRVVSPIVQIRLHPIDLSRMGHICNIESYLCEKKENKKKIFYLDLHFYKPNFSAKKKICNKQLDIMVRRLLFILPTFLIYPLWLTNNLLPNKNKYLVKPFHSDMDPKGLFDKYEKHFSFTTKEKIKGEKLLKQIGINDHLNFVCLNVRDSKYLQNNFPKYDSSYHNYRNWNIKSFKKGIDFLISKKIYVVRVGKTSREKLVLSSKYYIDISDKIDNDFLDVYLGANCKFCISTQSGFDGVPYIFRRPIAYITVPISNFHTSSKRFLVMTKIHKDIYGKNLNIKEIFQKKAYHIYSSQFFNELGIELSEPSQDEIELFIKDMVEYIENNFEVKKNKNMQVKFWKIYQKYILDDNVTKNMHTKFLSHFSPSLIDRFM